MNEPGESRAGRLRFTIVYGDCDIVGIVYFGIYYRWMERCYTLWLREHGIRGGEMAQDLGIITVGVSSGCEYLETVKVFDELTCQAVREHLGSTSYRLGFEFTRAGHVVTRGQMTFVCRTLEFGPTPVPDRLREALASLPESSALPDRKA